MRKLAIVCVWVLIAGFMVMPAFAIEYAKDFLEPGNPGGTGGLKTFDTGWSMQVLQTVDADIWLKSAPESMLTAGFYVIYDSVRVSIVDIKVYDGDLTGTKGNPVPCCPGLTGPWDPTATFQIPDVSGPGTYFVALANFGCVAPDPAGDIILARIRFKCEALGDAAITIRTIPDFETVVACDTTQYDTQIAPNNFIIKQICLVNADCDDNNACTTDSCDQILKICLNTPVPDGTSCEDGLFCTVSDQCSTGVCTSGSARDCSAAGNQCNDGVCDEGANQCVPQPVANGTPCNDGLFCTQAEQCQSGLCTGGGDTCPDDTNDCTVNCDEAADTCYACNATGSSDPCCTDPICASEQICLVTINEFYVDGTNGSNANDGLTPATAWKTITHALNQVPVLITLGENNRALVHVAPSLYDTVMGSGDAESFPLVMKKYLSLVADQGYTGTVIDAMQTGSVIEFTKEEVSGDTITLEGFTITGGLNFRGGGITVLWADPIINRCLITGNTATDVNGGGIYLQRSNATITDCIISGNLATQQNGGGISCGNLSSPAISNCTIADNGAGCGLEEGGGGLFAGAGSFPAVTNCILWDNYRNCSPDPVSDQIQAVENLVVSYSCIEGGYAGTGNTSDDPAFFGTQYFLSYGSPCIDSGTSEVDTVTLNDIDGNARYDHLATPNTGAGTSPYYDMGAREYQNDTDGDGILDDADENGVVGDNPCAGGATVGCDDNCIDIPNPAQEDVGDSDGAGDVCDNCPTTPNAPALGTCVRQQNPNLLIMTEAICTIDGDCPGTNEFCERSQLDANSNGIGDVCECEGDFDCDRDVDGSDAFVFKDDFGRNAFNNPCTVTDPCPGDFDGDGDVDGSDAAKFKEDFGRNEFNKPCPPCV